MFEHSILKLLTWILINQTTFTVQCVCMYVVITTLLVLPLSLSTHVCEKVYTPHHFLLFSILLNKFTSIESSPINFNYFTSGPFLFKRRLVWTRSSKLIKNCSQGARCSAPYSYKNCTIWHVNMATHLPIIYILTTKATATTSARIKLTGYGWGYGDS